MLKFSEIFEFSRENSYFERIRTVRMVRMVRSLADRTFQLWNGRGRREGREGRAGRGEGCLPGVLLSRRFGHLEAPFFLRQRRECMRDWHPCGFCSYPPPSAALRIPDEMFFASMLPFAG